MKNTSLTRAYYTREVYLVSNLTKNTFNRNNLALDLLDRDDLFIIYYSIFNRNDQRKWSIQDKHLYTKEIKVQILVAPRHILACGFLCEKFLPYCLTEF